LGGSGATLTLRCFHPSSRDALAPKSTLVRDVYAGICPLGALDVRGGAANRLGAALPPKRVGLEPREAAAKFGSQLAASVGRFRIFNWVILGFTRITSAIGLSAAVVLLLFILHQLFLWVDQEPEKAFERAALLLEVVEVVWDTLGILVNAVVDVSNAALIPIWNAYT
jgi:hypothetical protein